MDTINNARSVPTIGTDFLCTLTLQRELFPVHTHFPARLTTPIEKFMKSAAFFGEQAYPMHDLRIDASFLTVRRLRYNVKDPDRGVSRLDVPTKTEKVPPTSCQSPE